MSAPWEDMVTVGVIIRPHGLRGHVIVQPETDFPDERFAAGATVFAAPTAADAALRALEVKDARWHLGRLLVAFEGVERLEEAEQLGRGELRISPERLAVLPPGRFYHHQLVGCAVTTVGGEAVGTVTRIEGTGAASVLVISGRRADVLVPLAEGICAEIDVDGRRIVVAPPEGLLDLNT
jgi:16S rRNA processing protein RimM